MRQDLESRYQEFGRNNLAILILGMILVKIVHKIFSLGGGGGGGGGDRLILLKAFIRGPKYESGEGEARQVPLSFGGPNTKRETPSGLMHFYKYHN